MRVLRLRGLTIPKNTPLSLSHQGSEPFLIGSLPPIKSELKLIQIVVQIFSINVVEYARKTPLYLFVY